MKKLVGVQRDTIKVEGKSSDNDKTHNHTPYYSRVDEKLFSFTMTARSAGSTQSLLLPMNVILVKECEESNSPTP